MIAEASMQAFLGGFRNENTRKIMKLEVITGLLLILFLASMLTLAFNIQLIKADGSVYPSTANIMSVDNVIYSFTDNINDSLSLVKKYFPVYNFSAGERWYPCSFYFDNDTDLYNKDSYDSTRLSRHHTMPTFI